MKFVIVFAFAIVFTLPCALATGRIFKGKDAATGQFPYQARIELRLSKDLLSICGASLIATNWLLTAAHCVIGSSEGVTVYLANNPGLPSKQIVIHKNYNYDTNENDIALIEIPAVTLTKEVDKIQLPKMGGPLSNYAGEDVTAAGWGQMGNDGPSPKKLQWTTLKVLPNKYCEAIHHNKVLDGMICATGADFSSVCNGDSGGPLVLTKTNTQVGIASCTSGSGCESGLPCVFTRVSHYLEWINENTGVVQKQSPKRIPKHKL